MGSRVLRNSQLFSSKAQFKHNLLERFFVRFHMTLALSGVCVSGLLVSKLLLELGLRSMLERYLVAVCVSYLFFFLLGGSVLRATCIPFLIVLLMTEIFVGLAHKYNPRATRLTEIFQRSAAAERR